MIRLIPHFVQTAADSHEVPKWLSGQVRILISGPRRAKISLFLVVILEDSPSIIKGEAEGLEEIDENTGIQLALDAIENGRLALVCGAGLSMSPPSNIPSAQTLADRARVKYDATIGMEEDGLPLSIEAQAAFFYAGQRLSDYYLRSLIDPHVFSAEPNPAHYAVADLLLTRGADIAVSTNVDRLIETAGMFLHGHIQTAIDREHAAAAPQDTSVLFKLHGCWDTDRANTLWCVEQLADPPLSVRIPESAQWLENRLLDRDLVVVGYFTHWEHLTAALGVALQAVQPARLIIVDPASAEWLQEKAPDFFALGERAGRFCHVTQNGSAFLDRLRISFSRRFIRKILHAGREAYIQISDQEPDAEWLEPEESGSANLWLIRRDLEGCMPPDPAIRSAPLAEPVLGLTLLRFRARGATWLDSYLDLEGEIIRVFRATQQPLHSLEAAFEGVTPPLTAETIVAVGAVDLALKPNVARSPRASDIARGNGRRWITREAAEEEYQL